MARRSSDNSLGRPDTLGRFAVSPHFIKRQAQRGIGKRLVALALCYGQRFYEGEDQVYFLGRKQIPETLDARLIDRADGTVVVVGGDGQLVTTYRNPRYVRTLKRRQ